MEGMTSKFDISKNKLYSMNLDIFRAAFGQLADEALQVYQLFTGDGGKIHNYGDNNSDAGAGDGAVDQMIIPIQAV